MMKLILRSIFGLSIFIVTLLHASGISAKSSIAYNLGEKQTFKIIEGNISLDYGNSGHISPGEITLKDLQGKRALISVGEEYPVNANKSYNLSAWIKTIGRTRGRTRARPIIQWYDNSRNEIGSVVTPWAFAEFDWMEYENAGIAPDNAKYGKTFLEVQYSSLGPPPPGFKPTTFIVNHLTVIETPRIEIGTGRQCNLIFEGEPLNVEITVDDIPDEYKNALVEGVILNYRREPVAEFEISLSGGKAQKTFSFNSLSRGYYQVEWNLKKSGAIERSGILSASILPSLHSRIQDKDTPWAFDSGLSYAFDGKPEVTMKNGMYMVKAAGAHWLRERGGTRETAKMQQEQGVEPYYILQREFRRCLRNSSTEDSSSGTLHLMEVYEGSKKLAEQYGDLVKYWETWNEPDVSFFSPARASEFAAIQKAAYLGTHAGNPNAKVHNGSWSTRPKAWHVDLLRNGMNEYFDIFNMHYYETYDPLFTKPIGVVERIRKYMEFFQECGIDRKQSWMTEFGYHTVKNNDGTWWRSEEEQAIHAVRSTCHCLARGINKFFIFYLQEFLENCWYIWGITRQDWTPKPAYTAYANMSYMLGKGDYTGYYDLGLPNSYGYVFDTGKENVIVAWAQEEGKISLPGDNISAVDLMGAPVSPENVSRFPIYISGVDLNSLRYHPMKWTTVPYSEPDIEVLSTILALRGVKEKDAPMYPKFRSNARHESIIFPSDEVVTLEFKVCNFSDNAKDIALEWTLPQGWTIIGKEYNTLKAGPWSEQNFPVNLQPEIAESGEFYPIAVNGTAAGRTITQAYLKVQIQ